MVSILADIAPLAKAPKLICASSSLVKAWLSTQADPEPAQAGPELAQGDPEPVTLTWLRVIFKKKLKASHSS